VVYCITFKHVHVQHIQFTHSINAYYGYTVEIYEH